jgi:hypothetical protein
MEASRVKIVEETGEEIRKMQKTLRDAEEAMNEHRNDLQTKYNDKLRSIKDICSAYFDKYESQLGEQKLKLEDLADKFAAQNKLLLQPQEVNKARLFNLELRVKDQEQSTCRLEAEHKEVLRKLLYALE